MNETGIGISAHSIPILLRFPEPGEVTLSASEAFLLSRIDGVSDVATLVSLCALTLDQGLAHLRALQRQGFVGFKAARPVKNGGEKRTSILSQLDDEDRQAVGSAIPRAQRQKIRLLAEQIADLSYYQVLGVPRTGSAEAVKKAYLGLSKEMHPDRYFGKEIGDYKALLDKIFSQVNKAHEVLGDREKRAHYDHTLKLAESGPAAEEGGEEEQAAAAHRPAVQRAPLKPLEQVLAEEDVDPALAAVDREARRRLMTVYHKLDRLTYYELLEVKQKTAPEGIERAVQFQLARFDAAAFPKELGPYERRRQKIVQQIQLAKKVLLDPTQRERYDRQLALEGAVEEEAAATRPAGGGFLENLYRAKCYFERGQQEWKAGNKAGALSHFQLAATLNPREKSYRQALEKLKWVAQEVRQENLLKRAQQKEKERDYKSAFEFYEKAYEADQKTPPVYRGLAQCLLLLNRDLHLARDYAQKAVALQADDGHLHCLLGLVLRALGEEKGAKKEFKRALELDKTCEEAAAALAAAKT